MDNTYIEPEGFKGTKGEFLITDNKEGAATEIVTTEGIATCYFGLSKLTEGMFPRIEEAEANALLFAHAKELLKQVISVNKEIKFILTLLKNSDAPKELTNLIGSSLNNLHLDSDILINSALGKTKEVDNE